MSDRAQRAIMEWRAAYRRCHGTEVAPPLLYESGWVRFCDGTRRKYRVAQIAEMTARLNRRSDELAIHPKD